MKGITEEGPDLREQSLEMFHKPDRWPMWPILPVKRYVGPGRCPDTGVLMHGAGPMVWIGCIGMTEWTTAPVEKFGSYELLLDAGWEVD